jgi:hypothetical protein
MAAKERSIVVALLALVLARTVRAMAAEAHAADGGAADGAADAKLPPIDVPTDESPDLPVDEKDPTAFTTEVRSSDYGERSARSPSWWPLRRVPASIASVTSASSRRSSFGAPPPIRSWSSWTEFH